VHSVHEALLYLCNRSFGLPIDLFTHSHFNQRECSNFILKLFKNESSSIHLNILLVFKRAVFG
jgi:hypothetical protein